MKNAVLIFSLALLTTSSLTAQNSISVDEIVPSYMGQVFMGDTAVFYLRIQVDDGIDTRLREYSNGFRVYSPDGASWGPVGAEYLPVWPYEQFDLLHEIEIRPDTVHFAGIAIANSGAPPGYDHVAWTISVPVPVDWSQLYYSICLDTIFVPPGGEWIWRDNSSNIMPSWAGPACFEIAECWDVDQDQVCDHKDNCPETYNPDQADADGVGPGDACCCIGVTGNINGDAEEKVDISDLSRLINSLFIYVVPQITCPDEWNVNGDSEGAIDISDVTSLVNHLFVTYEPLPPCPAR